MKKATTLTRILNIILVAAFFVAVYTNTPLLIISAVFIKMLINLIKYEYDTQYSRGI